MRGHDRRPRWRRAVYAPRDGMTNGCRVLLLRLSDDMNANGVVSIPRKRLADELGVAPARITEQMNKARSLGFIAVVRRARPGVTAVYQAMTPQTGVRPGVPTSEVRPPGRQGVRPGVPTSGVQGYALPHTQEGVRAGASSATPAVAESRNEAGYEKTHERAVSIDDPRSRRRESA